MLLLKSEDYFRFNAPFRQWLYNTKGKQLGDYKTDQAKEIFANEFVVKWNNKELDAEFYAKGSNYKTDFSKKNRVNIIKQDSFGFSKEEESRLFSHKLTSSSCDVSTNRSNQLDKSTDKSYLKRRAEDLEELVPKKEGHAKLIENRRLKSSHTRHEKHTEIELSDDQLFSSASNGSDDYAGLLRKERERKERIERENRQRAAEKEERSRQLLEKYRNREDQVKEMFKKMIRK